MARSPLMHLMIKAADKAARGLKRDFSEIEHLQVSRKGARDFVTNADSDGRTNHQRRAGRGAA